VGSRESPLIAKSTQENRTRGSAFEQRKDRRKSLVGRSFSLPLYDLYRDHRRGQLLIDDDGVSRNDVRIDNALLGGHRTRALPHAPRATLFISRALRSPAMNIEITLSMSPERCVNRNGAPGADGDGATGRRGRRADGGRGGRVIHPGT